MWLRHYIIREALMKPGAYIGLLLRDLQRLKRTHARQLTALLRDVATVNRSDWTWIFPNGSVIQFIGLQHEGDELNFNSTECDLLAWDELTEFSFDQYTYMLSRLRSAAGHGGAHSIAATNPLGTGYSWVKRYWVKPKEGDLFPGQAMPGSFEMWAPPIPGEEDGTFDEGPTRLASRGHGGDRTAVSRVPERAPRRSAIGPSSSTSCDDADDGLALDVGHGDAPNAASSSVLAHASTSDRRKRSLPLGKRIARGAVLN